MNLDKEFKKNIGEIIMKGILNPLDYVTQEEINIYGDLVDKIKKKDMMATIEISKINLKTVQDLYVAMSESEESELLILLKLFSKISLEKKIPLKCIATEYINFLNSISNQKTC
ncbi:MAG: hypothetical protein ACRC0K_00475 [Fusobacteriaceae bacterium]